MICDRAIAWLQPTVETGPLVAWASDAKDYYETITAALAAGYRIVDAKASALTATDIIVLERRYEAPLPPKDVFSKELP